MMKSAIPLQQLVGPALLERFQGLNAVPGFREILMGSDKEIETDDWEVRAASGLRAISLHFSGAIVIEVACMYRDRREEFSFLAREVADEAVAPTLLRFLEMILALPKDSLSGKSTIREILDYRECKGIY